MLLAPCAPIAIAASVALTAFPATAQDAVATEPVIVLPVPAPAAAPVATTPVPAPTIVFPAMTAALEPAAATEAAPAAPRAAQSTTRATAARSSVRAPAVRAPVAVPPVPTVQTAAPITATQPVADAAPQNELAEPAPLASALSDNTNEIALAVLLGALGLAAVGGVAFAATRRRRRNVAVPYDAVAGDYAVEPVASPERMTSTAFEPSPAPVFTSPTPVASATAPASAAPRQIPAIGNGDPVALPNEVPETFEERDALLKELMSAEPDKANPFTGIRARARRAKLIMQSLGHDFRDRKPRIDLSEYTNRWPALRGWQPATA